MVDLPPIEPNEALRELTGFDALVTHKVDDTRYEMTGVRLVDGKPLTRKVGTITRTSGELTLPPQSHE